MRPVVSIHDKLMCTSDQLEVVGVVELLTDVLSERVSSSSWGDTPSASIIRIRPEKIANWTFVWHFHDSVKLLDLIQSIDTWGETSMQAEDVSFDDGSQGKVVEEGGEVLPYICVSVFPEALVVEAVDLGDLLTLVVTSKDSDSVRVPDLQCNQKSHCFYRVVSSIDVVAHEKVVVVGELASNFEKFLKVVELTVDISADGDWGANWLHIAFIDKKLLSFFAESLDAVLWQRLAFV